MTARSRIEYDASKDDAEVIVTTEVVEEAPIVETGMQRHKYNNLPEMSVEEFERLKEDIKANGFDSRFPIMMYQNTILDGWHRWLACEAVHVTPVLDQFDGNDLEAYLFVLRSYNRRNLTPKQYAERAVENMEMLVEVRKLMEAEAKENRIEGNKKGGENKSNKILVRPEKEGKKDYHKTTTKVKVAEQFKTTPYLLDKALDKAKKLKNGEATLAETMRIENTEALATEEESEDCPVIQLPKAIPTDKQMLKLIKIARNRIAKLDGTIIKKNIKNVGVGMLQVNVQPTQKIKEIRDRLGFELTKDLSE